MKKIIVFLIALIALSGISVANAGYGECKRCCCYGYENRGDLICVCGHGYGMHRP